MVDRLRPGSLPTDADGTAPANGQPKPQAFSLPSRHRFESESQHSRSWPTSARHACQCAPPRSRDLVRLAALESAQRARPIGRCTRTERESGRPALLVRTQCRPLAVHRRRQQTARVTGERQIRRASSKAEPRIGVGIKFRMFRINGRIPARFGPENATLPKLDPGSSVLRLVCTSRWDSSRPQRTAGAEGPLRALRRPWGPSSRLHRLLNIDPYSPRAAGRLS